MGHHLRKDNNCLNCGATVQERYCTRCGQQNIETKESFGHVLRHFFEDFTHYDSKFLTTIKALLIKPGFVTSEFVSGRRQRYLHPIRMYLFISFIYFLVVFSLGNFEGGVDTGMRQKASYDDRKIAKDTIEMMLADAKRDTTYGKVTAPLLKRVREVVHLPSDTLQEKFNLNLFGEIDYRSLVRYDSIQRTLPVEHRDSGIKPWLYRRWLNSIERYGVGSLSLIIDKPRHFFPKMMFILLPLFALVLMLLHSRKKFLYAEHAIFTLHFHSAVFLLFLVSAIIVYFAPGIKLYVNIVELVLMAVYLTMALCRVYQQPWWLASLKSIFIGILYLVFLTVGVMTIGVTALL